MQMILTAAPRNIVNENLLEITFRGFTKVIKVV